MNKGRVAKVGLALALASAVGFYLESGPRRSGTDPLISIEDIEMQRLLHEPRQLPGLCFKDGDARQTCIANYRGKVILLNIWATWCTPCRKEMPTLDRLQARLGGPDFEVIALSIDRDGLSLVKVFYEQIGIKNLRIYIDESGHAMSDLGVAAIPTTLLIDPSGHEIGRRIGPADWDSPALVKVIRDRQTVTAKPSMPSGKSQPN